MFMQVGLSINRKLQVSHTFGNDEKPHYLLDLSVVDEEWHSIMVKIDKKDLNIWIDENKHPVIENQLGSSRARVVFGDPSQLCNSFVGCVKDLVSKTLINYNEYNNNNNVAALPGGMLVDPVAG